jgi:hypothetical protein
MTSEQLDNYVAGDSPTARTAKVANSTHGPYEVLAIGMRGFLPTSAKVPRPALLPMLDREET